MATVLPSRQRVALQTFELQMKRRRMIAYAALLVLFEQSLIGIAPFTNWAMTDADAQGDLLRQILMLGTVGILLLAPANARPPMAVPASIVILLGYCLLTCAWALDPAISLRRLVLTAMVIWILVRSVGDLGAVRTLKLLRVTLAVLLVLNYLMVMASPYGKHMATVTEAASVIGNWRGIMPHKNVAGAACALTILLFAFDNKRTPMWLSAVVMAASLFFLIKTESKTAVGVLVLALGAGAVMRLYNPLHRSLVLPIGLVATTGIVGILMMYSGAIETILDDPTALTGRAAIWPLLLDYASEHLWTGAGFMSFWQIGPDSPIRSLTSGWVASTVAHGHNGYLDLLVTIGLPGLILAVLVLFVWPALRLLYSTNISRSRRALFVAIMVFCAGENMTESTLLDRASSVQVFLMIVVILIHRLSNQSQGVHHELRARVVQLASRARLASLRTSASALAERRRSAHAARRAARRGSTPAPVVEDSTA